MNFKKILGSFLSAMTLFTTSPVSVMAYDITDESSLKEFLTNKDINETGNLNDNISTTSEIEAKSAEIKLYASGNKILTGELLRFTGGSLILDTSNNTSTLSILNDIRLSSGVILRNNSTGNYNFGRILGSGTIDFADKSNFTASEINASSLSLRSGSTLSMYEDAATGADGSIYINGTLTLNGMNSGGNRTTLEANKIEATNIDMDTTSTINASDIKAASTISVKNNSTVNASNIVDGKNTAKVTADKLSVTGHSDLYADTIEANSVEVLDYSNIDLVGDTGRGLSKNGLLSVNGKLTINGNSTVKANSIEADIIDSSGTITIGNDQSVSTIKADTINITKGDYTNTVISGKTDDYSTITFASGGNVNFRGDLNQLQIKGGSTSSNATVIVNDNSGLTIETGPTNSTTKEVTFNNTEFQLGENASLNLNAKNTDIVFANDATTVANIETVESSKINIKSGGKNKVVLDNINLASGQNNGTLTISGNAQIKAGVQDTSGDFISGQVYVDKLMQELGSSLTMEQKSTLNANTVSITGSDLVLKDISNSGSDTLKDGIKVKDTFDVANSNIYVSGKSKITSGGNLNVSNTHVSVAGGGVLELGSDANINLDKDSNIETDGELKISGDNASSVHNLYSSVAGTGTLRKVGSSTLNIGDKNNKRTVKLDSLIIGANNDSQKQDFVGGTVNINENVFVKTTKVVGDTEVNIADKVKLGIVDTKSSDFSSSSIRFMNNNSFNSAADSKSQTVLKMGEGVLLSANTIELSVLKAYLSGGTIGTDETTKVIFGDKSSIYVQDNPVTVKVKNANNGGFVSNGAKIYLQNGGNINFDNKAIGSAAHWKISNGSTQEFAAGSWFDGIVGENAIEEGGIFYNDGGNIHIGDSTIIGYYKGEKIPLTVTDPIKYTDTITGKGNLVLLKGGGVYNTGYFGSTITGGISSLVSFINNAANGQIEISTGVFELVGKGGAIYNAADLDKGTHGEVSLGARTTFKQNGAGLQGGAIYNEASNSQRGGIAEVKNAISLGQETLFDLNRARYQGGAIYTTNLDPTKESVISIGKKSSFDNSDVGFNINATAPTTTTPDEQYFYEAEGGALYVDENATVNIGEHSGFFGNFSTYSGSAISNRGTIIFNDDGQDNDEALRNGQVVQGSIKFAGGGEHEDLGDASNTFYTHQGGAIYNYGGKFLTNLSDGTQKSGLYKAEFENNKALFGGAIYHYSLDTANHGESDLLAIENSTFTGNQAAKGIDIYKNPKDSSSQDHWQEKSSGGAIYNAGRNTYYSISYDPVRGYYPEELTDYNAGSQMKITSSEFYDNTAVDKGGAIYNDIMSAIEMSDLDFTSNSASKGGAIYNAGSDGTHSGATITTKLGANNEKIVLENNTAKRQLDKKGKKQTSPDDEYLGGALYNAGTIKQSGSTSAYDNEIIGFEFKGNVAGDGVGTDATKDTIGRGGAFYNASSGTTYVGNSTFDTNSTIAYSQKEENAKSEGGAIYNEQGTLIIGDDTKFINNGREKDNYESVTTRRGGAIYNNTNATTEINSTKSSFQGNAALSEGGAIYNAKDGNLSIKSGVSIGVKEENANQAQMGGGVFNAGNMTLEDNVAFVNNTAAKGGGLYLKEGSTVNADAAGLNHLSNVTFDSNDADYGAGLYVDKNVDIALDNVTFKGNSTSGIGSAFYNAGNMTLGANNKFSDNKGSLIGNSGTLTFKEGFKLDGLDAENQGNTSFITNEKDGVVNITTVNGKSLTISSVGDGSADGAAISLKDNSTINTDSVANTLKNAIFTKNKGNNGGAIFKSSTVDLTIDDTVFDGNIAQNGGAIYNDKGTLTIGKNTVFSNNNSAQEGGAIFNAANGTLEFDADYTGFSSGNGKNYSVGNGGAVANYGKMNIKYSTEDSNSIDFSYQGKDSSSGNGGALYLGNNSLVTTNGVSKKDANNNVLSYIKNGLFKNNTAQNGGALFNESNIVIEDTNFTGNVSGSAGGAIYNKGTVVDGKVKYGNLELILSEDKTLSDNKSEDTAGAVFNENGVVTITAKDGHNAVISNNYAYNSGGALVSEGEDGVLNINGNVIFKDNGTIDSNGVGGAIRISAGTLNFDTTNGDIVFEGNKASAGSAIFASDNATINFKGDDNHGITFTKDQTIASDGTLNKIKVSGSNIKFESDMSNFNGQYKQDGGTVTVSNNFMNLQGKDNEISGGTFILADGAKLAPTNDNEGNNLYVNGKYTDKPTIRFEKNNSSTLTDLSALYKDKNAVSNSGSSFTYTSDLGDAKITFTNAKVDLAFKQGFVDVVDEGTGKTYRKNSGIYDLVLDGGSDVAADKKTLSIGSDISRSYAIGDLTLGDAVKIDTNIKIDRDGTLSLEGSGLSENVKTIEIAKDGRLNIFNDTYETIGADGITTKYNTDLTFTGELKGNGTVFKGYKNSPTEDGLAGRAQLTFVSGSTAENFIGKYIQNAGTLKFEQDSTYFNNSADVIYKGDSTLILEDGVNYTGNTTIKFDEEAGGRFVLGTATDINMTRPDESIRFEGTRKDGTKVTNTVELGKDTTIQFTHGKTDVDASDDTISIGKDNAFSGVIIGGDEDNGSGPISIKVSTVGIEGKDTTFNVEENGKLGFGDVKFVDTAGTDVTGIYSPTVTLDKNSEFYLVSGRDNDFSNLNLSTKAANWSQTAGSLIKENSSKTTLTGDKTDLSGFHGTIVIKNGEIAVDDTIANDKRFAEDTHFDVSKLDSGAIAVVKNITSGNDMTFINGIGNEITSSSTGEENFALSIKNDKGGINFVKADGTEDIPDINVKNGSKLSVVAKGDISAVNDVNVISKFSPSGIAQKSEALIKSDEGKVTTGAISVIGATDGSTIVESVLGIGAKGDISTSNKNVTVKYGDLKIVSDEGSITLGDSTDTTNPALKVEKGAASVNAGGSLNINGRVEMSELTDNILLGGSSLTTGGILIENSVGKTAIIQATGGKANISGDVDIANIDRVQISATEGINIKAEGTDKGNVGVNNAQLDIISATGDINIAGNLSANNSKVTVGIQDTGVGGVTIGTNEGSAVSAVNSSVNIISEGLTKINGSVDFTNLSDYSGIYGNSVDINGDINVSNSQYETKFVADNGSITFGALNLSNNKNTTGNVTTTVASVDGDITAKSKVTVIDSDIRMSVVNGDINIAKDADGLGTAFELVNGKAEVISDGALNINGDVSMTGITDKSRLQGGTLTAGNLFVQDNKFDSNFVSSVGDISTKSISLVNNNDGTANKTTTIQSAGSIKTNNGNVDVINSNMHMNAQNGSVDLGTGNIIIDNSNSGILAQNGGITSGSITLKDTVGGNIPTKLQMLAIDGNITSGDINLSSNAELLQKTENSGNIKNGDITVTDNSKYAAISAGDYLAGNIIANVAENGEAYAIISAKGDITVNNVTASNLSDLYIRSTDGDITANDVMLDNIAVSPDMSTVEGNSNVIYAENGKVTLGNLSLSNMVPETTYVQGKDDVTIKSIALTNNKGTSAAGAVENRWTQIVAEDGDVNVTKDINVLSSNLLINAENGSISANDFIIKDSKIDGTTANSKYDAGTILASGVGNIELNSVSVADSVVGIGSVSGNIDIDKSITVSDTKSTTPSLDYADYLQTVINSEEGDVSVGRGVVTSEAGTPVDIITANTNTYVTVQGYDINLGNSTTDTAIKAKESLLIMEAGNDLNAENTALVVNDAGVSLEAEGALKIGSITSSTSAAGLESGNVAGIYAISNSGNVEVNGNISASYSTIGLESETGIAIKGKVDLQNSNAAIVSLGDVAIDGTVTLKNTVASTGTTSATGVSRFLNNNSSSSTLRTNNDTPDAEVNEYIAQIQEAVSDIDPHYTIDGNKVNIKGNLDVDLSVVKIGDNDNLSKLEVKGNTTIDDSVVMINASGDVVTNGFTSKDSIIGVNAKNFKASNMSISSSSKDSPAYFEMANGNVDVKNNMVLSNTILNAKNTTNVAVGGTGSFNYAYLNIPNASAQFGALKTKDTVVNLRNNDAHNTINVAGNYEVSGDNLYYMDFDPATGAYDRVHVGGAITGADGATITVNSNLVNKGDVANGYQIYDVFSANGGVSGINFGLQGETAYSTALANYQMQNLGNGKYAFKRTGYTPTALINPVAVQIGGFLTQVQTYDTAFDNLDMVMMLPMTAYGPNRYAVSEAEDAMVYSPLFIPELEKGVWFRPFANFENVDMHHVGGRVSSQTYGALAGGDTALKDLGNGYQGMMSAYVGYTGAHQDVKGISNYQNGGVVGVTGAIYKNGFFSGLTISANASGNTASTPYGDNDFFMLTAGAASKTGYNWELANGRFIIQPSWLMSYTFANIFDPNDIAGMKVDSSALHGVQLAPGLKFIGNFQNGWQPYLTVDYRFNICDKADYKVGVVDLPDAQVKSYIEYGLGMQKRWGDRFTGYGQFLGRGIGRNGVGLNLGMRWMVGSGRNPR